VAEFLFREEPVFGGYASIYEYLKLLRGQTFGLTVSLLNGATKVIVIDASKPVLTTGANWLVEPSHLLFNNGQTEVLIPLANVIAVSRSIGDEVVDVIVRFPTAERQG
jgi:hypothetical protein